jgi:hypothetical protein
VDLQTVVDLHTTYTEHKNLSCSEMKGRKASRTLTKKQRRAFMKTITKKQRAFMRKKERKTASAVRKREREHVKQANSTQMKGHGRKVKKVWHGDESKKRKKKTKILSHFSAVSFK